MGIKLIHIVTWYFMSREVYFAVMLFVQSRCIAHAILSRSVLLVIGVGQSACVSEDVESVYILNDGMISSALCTCI